MTNKMWGGRFETGPSEIMQEINASISYDKRLFNEDIDGSIAHATMLGETGIISKADVKKIITGLNEIRKEISDGKFKFSRELEDIHLNIENRLKQKIGDAAGRLHTARSRNDQVATDFKLYIRSVIDHLIGQINTLQMALSKKAESHAETVMPGYTHLQTAQPVTFGHHCLAYVEMLERDKGRLKDARARLNECPLGAAALAGTSFPIDRKMTATALGFDRPTANSLDSVADRDFVLETLSAASISAMHLSRLAEELVIWSSAEMNFVQLSDAYTTGSSIMPQKRNPDAAELVRAKIGRIIGAYHGLAMVMKGLPLAYAKDMQEDKELAFDALDNFSLALAAMAGMIEDLEPNSKNLANAAAGGFSTATDLADWLVRVLNLPFRDAHHVTGAIVAIAEKQNKRLDELDLGELQAIHPAITKDIFKVLSVENSVKSRTSYGGTAPTNVKKMARKWIKSLEKHKRAG